MIRAAATNHAHVSVCVDPSDYDDLLASLGSSQEAPDAVTHRKKLAWKAFQHCASYDTTVADWLWQQTGWPLFTYCVYFCLMNQCKSAVFIVFLYDIMRQIGYGSRHVGGVSCVRTRP